MTDFFAVTDATWPAARRWPVGPFLVREGSGGGKRVSAATVTGPWIGRDISAVEAAQARLGQTPLFMIRPGEDDLDAALAARGYHVVDPVIVHAADIVACPVAPPPLSAFAIWPPLEIMRDLWREGGIGPGRLAVMDRAAGPKAGVLGRANDRAIGVAFVAVHDETAMLHALHVDPGQRRQGTAVNIMRMSAIWAQDHGAKRLSVVVTRANGAANALYASLGMQIVGQYHYRSK